MYRIGFSEDIHPVVENRKMVLGGVNVPSSVGLFGHSDADVVLHTVAESILGALALGDLGSHFPDSDTKYKDIASSIIVKETVKLMKQRGFAVNNIDIQIASAVIRISPIREEMRKNIADLLETSVDNVSIKAMSFNKVGAIGKGEAIRSQCVVMLIKK